MLALEVLGHRPVVTCDAAKVTGRGVSALERQRREERPRGPALGPVCELGGLRRAEFHPDAASQEADLASAQREVLDADLEQLPGCP